jgi:exodeoxyribonuclease VII small subunit
MSEPKFEKDLEQLEGIVEALEQGELSLDESLKKFEEGIRLAKRCEKALTNAEKKIELLTKNAEGEVEAEPYGEEGAEAQKEGKPKRKPQVQSPESNAAPEDSPPEEDDEGLLF